MGLFRQLFSKWNRISYQIRKLPLSTLKLSNFGKKSVGGRSKSLYLQRHTALHLHQQNNPSPLLEMLDTSNDFPNLWAVAVRIIAAILHDLSNTQNIDNGILVLQSYIPKVAYFIRISSHEFITRFFKKVFSVESTSCSGSLGPTTVAAKAGTARRRPKLVESPNGNDSRAGEWLKVCHFNFIHLLSKRDPGDHDFSLIINNSRGLVFSWTYKAWGSRHILNLTNQV